MSSIKLSGIIETIFPSEIIGTSFEKRVFYLQEHGSQYPNTWQLETWNGDCNILDNFKNGDHVVCSVDVRGKAWKKGDRAGVINTLKCWSITKLSNSVSSQQAAKNQPQNKLATQITKSPPSAQINTDIDDAPF